MAVFEQIVRTMIDMGIFQAVFPWLLVLSVVYGALEKYEVFEDEMVNGAIALSMAFLTSAGMVMFVPQGLFSNFMAAVAFSAIGLLSIVILAAVGGFDFSSIDDKEDNLLIGLGILLVGISFVGAFLYQTDLSSLLPTDNVWDDAVMPVLTLLFLFLVMSELSSGEGGGED